MPDPESCWMAYAGGGNKMISAINYRKWQRGSVMGIFDLNFYGATVRGCKVMTGKNGFWISLPQQSYTDKNNETKYTDVIQMTSAMMNHVRRIIIEQLLIEGYIKGPASKPRPAPERRRPAASVTRNRRGPGRRRHHSRMTIFPFEAKMDLLKAKQYFKKLARQYGCKHQDLLALHQENDPFYHGTKLKRAKWFASVVNRLYGDETPYLRRLHYRMASQDPPVMIDDGNRPYLNNDACWALLCKASGVARNLGLIDGSMFIDKRSRPARIFFEPEDNGRESISPTISTNPISNCQNSQICRVTNIIRPINRTGITSRSGPKKTRWKTS